MAGGSCAPVSVPTASSARWRAAGSCKGGQEPRELPGGVVRVDRAGDLEQDVPGTRAVVISSGPALLATTSGKNGTFGSRASAVRT